jgi:hypothetical protein
MLDHHEYERIAELHLAIESHPNRGVVVLFLGAP